MADAVLELGLEFAEAFLIAHRHKYRVVPKPRPPRGGQTRVPSTRPSNVSVCPSLGHAIASAQAKCAAGAASGSVASTSPQTRFMARIQSRLPSASSAQRAEKMPGRPWSASTHNPLSSASAGSPDKSAASRAFRSALSAKLLPISSGSGRPSSSALTQDYAEWLDQSGNLAQLARIVGRYHELVADRPHRPTAFS